MSDGVSECVRERDPQVKWVIIAAGFQQVDTLLTLQTIKPTKKKHFILLFCLGDTVNLYLSEHARACPVSVFPLSGDGMSM